MEHPQSLRPYKKYIFLGIIVIALGVTFSNAMAGVFHSFGVVLIAVGGLFFIIGMRKKQLEDE
jgi:dolichyl-phosphate-mannose--protein O-mannosyl transferase